MTTKTSTQVFNKVYMTPLFNPNVGNDRPITFLDNPKDIVNRKEKFGCEFVGCNNKVSPYYDVDFPLPFDTPKDEIMRLKKEKDEEKEEGNDKNEFFNTTKPQSVKTVKKDRRHKKQYSSINTATSSPATIKKTRRRKKKKGFVKWIKKIF